MNIIKLYFFLTLIGAALPLYFFVEFLLENGLDVHLFTLQISANSISRFFGTDVVISALVTIAFVLVESRRLGIKKGPWCLLGLLIGVSVALPLFLFARERHILRKCG